MGTTLHTLKGPRGRDPQPQAHRPRSGLGHRQDSRARASRARRPAPVTTARASASRAVRCRCSAGFPRAGSRTRSGWRSSRSTSATSRSASSRARVDVAALQARGLVPRSMRAGQDPGRGRADQEARRSRPSAFSAPPRRRSRRPAAPPRSIASSTPRLQRQPAKPTGAMSHGVGFPEHRQDPGAAAADPVHAGAARGLPHRRLRHDARASTGRSWRRSSTRRQGRSSGMFNMFSGGALEQLSIFALGIMPYISASIILQLLTVVVPKLEQLQKEGERAGGRSTSTRATAAYPVADPVVLHRPLARGEQPRLRAVRRRSSPIRAGASGC